jgi:hypothetical protein
VSAMAVALYYGDRSYGDRYYGDRCYGDRSKM